MSGDMTMATPTAPKGYAKYYLENVMLGLENMVMQGEPICFEILKNAHIQALLDLEDMKRKRGVGWDVEDGQ